MTSSAAMARAALLACALAAGAAVAGCTAPAPAASSTTSSVEVTESPSGAGGPCVEAGQSVSSGNTTRTYSSSPTEFVLRISTARPLCSALDASAVVYAMPGDGAAWPQTLARSTPVRIQAAGTTTIRFTRGCGAAQFDVVTGPLPTSVDSPFAAPPLLFPLDVETAEQDWGNGQTNCSTTSVPTPPPAVPETPAAALLPAVAVAGAGAGVGLLARRRRRS